MTAPWTFTVGPASGFPHSPLVIGMKMDIFIARCAECNLHGGFPRRREPRRARRSAIHGWEGMFTVHQNYIDAVLDRESKNVQQAAQHSPDNVR